MEKPTDERIAVARQLDLPDGRRIWVPPTGKPFWCHCQPTVDLTDDEIKQFVAAR